MRRLLSILSLLAVLAASPAVAYGRDGFTIKGSVLEKVSRTPIGMSTVLLRENGLWTTTADDGKFEIAGVAPGTYTIEVSELGYTPFSLKVEVRDNVEGIQIMLDITSLSLNEVVVTAKEGGELTSASRISRQTLEHVQPSSLKDVMQLLPGGITQNPNMTTSAPLSIRDIGSNAANALGTALIVDGATLSNDANMQMLSSGTAINSGTANVTSTAGGGVDARQLSTDNIESVQVIRGIPSVVYGDLTSGAVVVKTKAGVTPWEVRIKADPNLKQISAGKGFALGGENGRRGKMNFDADYAKAMSDVRTSSSAYRRANFRVGYSNTFNKKLLFNARLSGNWSDATNASDPDLFLDEIARESERGLRFNVNGRWLANLKWLTNVEYLVSGSVVSQYSRQRTYQGSAGYTATTTEMYDTENKGFFTQPQYYSDVEVFGLPIDMQARFTAHHSGQFGKVHNKALIGGEWKLGGNSGRGKVFDPYCPPSPGSGQAYRERSYRDVPYLHRFTGYAEDNISLPIGPTKLEVQAGVRGNMLAAAGLNTASLRSLEPRFNGKLTAISNREHIQSLSFRAGWGLACKMPSMVYLYPEPSYKDMVSFSYNDFDATGYGLNVLTTKRVETINNYLSLQCSRNFETGVEFETDFIDGSVVYYNENMTGGYAFATTYVPMSYTRYGYSWQGDGLSQMLLPSGCNPQYWPGEGVTVASEPIPSVVDTTFMSYTTPVNAISNHKRGVEFTLDFKQFKPLSTSVSVSGAYMRMESSQNWLSHRLYPGSVGGRTYPYVGIYYGTSTSANASVKERFATNVRFITHLSRMAMVVTTTLQMVFIDRTQQQSLCDGLSMPYFYDDLGQRVDGQAALEDTEHTKYINPLYIMDRSGRIMEFTREMERDDTYRNLILTTNTPTYYIRGGYPFYGMLNIRLTKEIGKVATISFYANNFLNLRGRVEHSVTGYPNDRNTPIYFGAEAKITLR